MLAAADAVPKSDPLPAAAEEVGAEAKKRNNIMSRSKFIGSIFYTRRAFAAGPPQNFEKFDWSRFNLFK